MISEKFFDTDRIVQMAEASLLVNPPHITDHVASLSDGGIHDYYSNGDYWWKNPNTENGLPYVKYDGKSNPDNFFFHRIALRKMRTTVANLAAGYKLSGREEFAAHGVRILREFFLDEDTCMSPHLKYSQAIPGITPGHGTGIIDSLHLTEIPYAIKAFEGSASMTAQIHDGLKGWFSDYLDFMNNHKNGIDERDSPNNHSICWHVQTLSFAGFVGNTRIIDECVHRYKTVLLPNQMQHDGGFTSELGRTKPYGYSIFVLDNAVTLVHIASKLGEDLWNFSLPDGRSILRGLNFLMPYLEDKSTWFLPPDVEHFSEWPARASFMVFAGIKSGDERYLRLWSSLPPESTNIEVRRNLAIRQPILMV